MKAIDVSTHSQHQSNQAMTAERFSTSAATPIVVIEASNSREMRTLSSGEVWP
ncbi:MAG TPA: hypothetical protein VN643_19325 [Pyrinomonadaceae bacterium]|nr:hypothetical protein [Pyrinomonadaceae bacterium]